MLTAVQEMFIDLSAVKERNISLEKEIFEMLKTIHSNTFLDETDRRLVVQKSILSKEMLECVISCNNSSSRLSMHTLVVTF